MQNYQNNDYENLSNKCSEITKLIKDIVDNYSISLYRKKRMDYEKASKEYNNIKMLIKMFFVSFGNWKEINRVLKI